MSSPNVVRAFFRGVVVLVTAFPIVAYGETLPFVGEINDRQVNVRSGPSTNYYVVSRLQAGARVQVIAEESGWYGIVPPEGCYSVISKEYVDIGENNAGTVNASAVRVRAGSDLDAHRYAVQTKLNKGDAVAVMGEADGGYLKIAPPAGARVWIHSDYVVRVAGEGEVAATTPGQATTASAPPAPAGETLTDGVAPTPTDAAQPPADPNAGVTTPEGTAPEVTMPEPVAPEATAPDAAGQGTTAPETVTPEGTAPEVTTPEANNPEITLPETRPGELAKPTPISTKTEPAPAKPSTTTPSTTGGSTPAVITREPDPSVLPAPSAPRPAPPSTAWRNKLTDADAAFKAEMAKPLAERSYDSLIPLYQPLATQSEDKVIKLVAERRIAQLESNKTAAVVLREIEVIATDAERDRSEFADARDKLRKPLRTATEGYEAVGEFRESLVFDTPTGPRRFRLTDPNVSLPRTMCYIEFPPDMAVDANAFLGRMVAVKAREKYLETGDVNPIPVIVVQEITLAPSGLSPQVFGMEDGMVPPSSLVEPSTSPAAELAPPPSDIPAAAPQPSTPGSFVTLPSTGAGAATPPASTTPPPAPTTQSNPPVGTRTEPQMGTMVPVTGSGR